MAGIEPAISGSQNRRNFHLSYTLNHSSTPRWRTHHVRQKAPSGNRTRSSAMARQQATTTSWAQKIGYRIVKEPVRCNPDSPSTWHLEGTTPHRTKWTGFRTQEHRMGVEPMSPHYENGILAARRPVLVCRFASLGHESQVRPEGFEPSPNWVRTSHAATTPQSQIFSLHAWTFLPPWLLPGNCLLVPFHADQVRRIQFFLEHRLAWKESNLRPVAYKTTAQTTELHAIFIPPHFQVGPEGLEPPSNRLKVCCVSIDTTTPNSFCRVGFPSSQLLAHCLLPISPSGSPRNRTWRNSSISRAWATSPRLPGSRPLTAEQWSGRRSNPYLLGFNQALCRLSYRTVWIAFAASDTKKARCSNTGPWELIESSQVLQAQGLRILK